MALITLVDQWPWWPNDPAGLMIPVALAILLALVALIALVA